MSTNVKQFTIIKGHAPILFFDGRKKEESVVPMLWCREGEFRLIPKEVMLNFMDLAEINNKTQGKITNPQPQIMWSQGIPISNQAGRALVGE
ncbi:hypothetical protein LCGC14_0661380 [marine sediment metagenome]|uniref:Uncharacterized protein n=1 Tax=marine sediment metagenome TaxID=412755 RepID=A0A0F9QTD9_9ZZZZ